GGISMANYECRSERWPVILVFLMFTSFAIPLFLRFGAHRLGTRMRRVARIRDAYHVQVPPYVQWQPDHKLILCRVREPMGAAGDYTFGRGFYFVELDPWSGKETPISGLNRHFPIPANQFIGY